MARLRGRILVLSLILLLFLALAAQAEPSQVVQAEEILKKIELGQPVEYDNVTILGYLDVGGLDLPMMPLERTNYEIQKYKLLPKAKQVKSAISITNSKFDGLLNLNGVYFAENVSFNGDEFDESVYLSGAKFSQNADFMGALFNQNAYFSGAQFESVYFDKSIFAETVIFESSHFNRWASFQGAVFENNTNFQGARFNTDAYFLQAVFNQTFWGYSLYFNETANFNGAHFYQDANFPNVIFEQSVYFANSDLLNACFDDSQFSKEAIFSGALINGTLSLNRTKYDKLNIRWSSINDLAYDDTAYYLLIENFKKQGFTDDASECYYSYRCKHREELFRQGKVDSWFFDLLAWATNGYGLRPVRPLGWSMLFILLGGAFFFVTKSISRSKGPEASGNRRRAIRGKDSPPRAGEVSFWEALLLSATYFTSGASAIISSVPQEFSPLGRSRYVVVILRLLGWIFFVLFLTSLGKIA